MAACVTPPLLSPRECGTPVPAFTATGLSSSCRAHRGAVSAFITRLVLAVAAGIRARGETPFLHAAASNTGAIRLYESLGFRLRKTTVFSAVRVPAGEAVA